jgi:hypothetical protein
MRIISNTNNEYLYLCKNKINNIDQLIKIIYRTKLIKIDEQKKNEEIYINESSFFNLDLSYNICINKNEQKIKLFKDILEDTTLFCLDFSHILYGKKPSELIEIKEKGENPGELSEKKEYIYKYRIEYRREYRKLVGEIKETTKCEKLCGSENDKSLKDILERKKNEYYKIIDEIRCNQVDINKYEIKYKSLYEDISLSDILNDKEYNNSPIFFKEKAKELICKTNKIREKVFKENIFNRIKYDEIHEDLVNYIMLKRAEKNLEVLKKRKKNIKMIII